MQASRRLVETHPEMAFAMMAGQALAAPKKRSEGKRLRRALLEKEGFREEDLDAALSAYPRKQVAHDDVLDAFACAWVAARVATDQAVRFPEEEVPRDERGLEMVIWA